MRLSDARLRCRKSKQLYPDHRLPPSLTEDATRDRSNRLLAVAEKERHATNTRCRAKDPRDRRRQEVISNNETNLIWSCHIGDLSKCPNKHFKTDTADARWA